MPLTYRQTKDIYDTLKDAGATTLSLPDWSRQMAATTESDTFDAGLKDNWLKRLNTSIDRGIEWTGLPGLTGEFGAGIGSAFGMEEAGRSAGESIPRMAADMATFFIPGLGASTAAARILPAMGMAGMGAYTETGSPAAGVASAALMGVLPGATDMAEQWALKRLGGKLMAGDIVSRASTNLMDSGVTEGLSKYMPQNLAQGAGAYTTGQAAAMGLMGGSTMAQQAFAGEEISNPFTGEFWLSQGIQNIPFMALHGAKKLAGPSYGKAIEATGQALLEGRDALAWKQLQRDVADYGKAKDKSSGEGRKLTPKAQAMWDRAQGKPATEEERSAAQGWLEAADSARRDNDPDRLQKVEQEMDVAIRNGDVPFSAFVDNPNAVEVKGEITGISKSGKQVTAWVDTPEGRQKVQFSRGLRTGAHEIGQTVFKMPVDPTYVTWNPEKSEAWKAKEAADAAQADAKRAQEDLKGKIDLHVEAHRPDELVAKAKGFVGEAEFAAQVDEAAKRNALLRENAKGEIVATADSRVGDELDAAKRIVAQHDTAFVADRASAEELARKSEGLTAEAFRLEREARQQKLQEVSQLVAQFNSLPMTTKEEKMSKRGVAMQIEGLLTGAGLPSMFDRKATRWGPLAGVTAHNLGLALDSKGVLWLKGMLSELKVADSRVREKPKKNKKISLDRAAEQGDSLMGEAEAEVRGSQREFDSELNSSEKQHEITTVLEGARTEDPIIASAHEDIILKELQDNLDGLQELFDAWNGDREIEFGGTEGELLRMQKYVKARLDAGEKFDAKLFWDSQNVDLVAAGGDLATFEQRPHVLTLLNGVTEQLNRPGTPLAAKARVEQPRLRPAVRVDGVVYTKEGARNHAEVDYTEQAGRDENSAPAKDFDLGFVTPEGKYLTGAEAWTWANEQKGMKEKLAKDEFAARPGNSGKTELDSAGLDIVNEGRPLAAKKKKWEPTPESIRRIAHREFNGGGRKLAEVISAMEDADPADRAMAELLIRNLPETLSRVESEFNANGETEYAPMIRQRKGKITFAPWNIGESDNSWAGTAMEELQHHVGTIALRDPKNKEAFNGFENLRKRVIAGLSKEKGGELEAFNYLEKLYKKNPNRYIKQGQVHKDSKIEDLVYALQNVDEFYANGNRAHALRERLVSMEPTKHWLSEFVDNLKKLFGIGPKETAFDEFLFHTKQIMDSSEAVAKSFNYLEAHFAQRGYDPNRANDATQVAMRLMNKHGVGKGDPQTLFAELAKPSDMDSDQLLEAKGKFEKLMASPDDVEMGSTALLFNDPNTGKALENWFMEQLDTPSSVSYFNAMPEKVQNYLSLRVQQMQDVLSGIHNLSKNGSSPVTDLLEPKTLERTAKDMLERLQPFVRQQDVVRTAVSQVRAVESFGTENMLEVMGRPLAAKAKGETPDGFIDEKMGFLRKLTLQIGQWAQSNPLVKELLVRMTGSDTLARKFAQSAQHDVLGYDPANPGVYNEKIAEGWREWLEDGRNKDVVDKITSTNQVVGKDKVKLLAPDHPAMVAATKGIAPEVLAKAHQFVKQKSIGTQKGQAHILHRMGENGTVQGAKLVLLQETDVNVETAMTASRNVLDALVAIKENPADVMAGRKLEAAQKVLQPKTMEALMETHDRMSKVLIAAKLHFKNNDGWVSVQRRGEFLYKGFRGTEEINMGADSDKEVLARARKHGVKIDLKTKKANDPGDYATMDWSQEFIDKAKAYDEHAYDAARAAGASDKVLETIQKMAPGAAILKDQHVSYDIGAGESKGRTLSKGGDIVPFTDHFFSWLEGSPAYWNKRLIREQVEMTLLAPEYRAAPETSATLRQWLNGFLTPDPKPMRALQKAVTTFTLGGNVGFLLNNVFQPFLRGIPEMMSHGVSFWAAFRGVTGALKDAVKSFTKVGGMTDLSKGLPDANERWFMERLNNDLITDRSLFDETEMRKGYDSYKLTASLNASKPKTFGQWVASVGGAYSNVALSMVRHGERANTEATSLGAFRALMRTFPEKGREWAEQKARDVHQATNDPGGRFNRAIGLYDNAGPASRSAAMMAGALQSYTFGTIHQILRNFQKGWRNSSLTPAEKYAGRKAFLTQLGLQFAVAGALGMPFVSGALALINQVDPSLEINKNVRGLMQQFFAEDGKDGHPLTDMMMSGLPSQLGWDMQSRMSSGELIPGVSERDGFQVSNLFGVPASLATQMAGGVRQIMNGQGAGLMAFVPPGLRSQIRLATGTAGQDNKGRQVLNDMTPGEGVGLALGMRPTRLREFNDAQRMEKQAEEQDAIRKGRWRQKAAAQVLKGEFGTVMGELKTKLAENPRLDVAGEVRQIARYAEDQAFPRDLRREAKGDQRSELLRMWNLAPSMPTEEQRLQFRMKVEQQFGVRGDSGRALMNARMMDELRKQRPDATRSELRGMLPRVARPQPMLAE